MTRLTLTLVDSCSRGRMGTGFVPWIAVGSCDARFRGTAFEPQHTPPVPMQAERLVSDTQPQWSHVHEGRV